MSDNPNLRGRDGTLLSKQPHEIEYAISVLVKEFPKHTREEIRMAIESASKEAQPSEERERILNAARANLAKY